MVASGAVMAWTARNRLRGRGFDRMPTWGAWSLIGISGIVLVAAFVIPAAFMRPKAPAAVRPASTATVSFTEPTPGQHVSGETMEVSVALTGGKIVATTSTTLTPDTGHLHLYIDDRLISMAYGATRQQVPIADLQPGPHVLRVEFVAADHGPFNPRVEASVPFVKDG
jgi:hypothetical protein